MFRQDTTCPALLTLIYYALTYTRVSLCPLCLSMQFYLNILYFWALSRSLAATWEISVDFFSSGYLDVSVPLVRFVKLCIHLTIVQRIALGFPIRTSSAITVHITLPTLFAD